MSLILIVLVLLLAVVAVAVGADMKRSGSKSNHAGSVGEEDKTPEE